MPVLRHFAAVGVGVADGVKAAKVEVADVKAAEVEVTNAEVADVDARLMTTQEVHRVAESVDMADESPMSSTIFLLPNPSMKEDFTLRPTAAAAFTAACSSSFASDENIPGNE